MTGKAFYMDGDKNAEGHRRSNMDRIMHGLITAVDADLGIVSVDLEEAFTAVQIQLAFDSFSFANETSSWFRHMPQVGSSIIVGFHPSGEAQILGYSPINYSQLSDLKEQDELKAFRPLRPGEYDLRSTGGAGFYATERGDWITYAGATQFVMNADANEARGIAGLNTWTSANDEFRFGDVKRNFADDLAEEHAVPGSIFKEFSFKLVDPVAGILKKAVIQLGDVFSFDTIVPIPDIDPNTGLFLRGRFEMYDATGITKSSLDVSNAGDMTISVGPLAQIVGMQILGLLNRLTVRFLIILVQAVTSLAIQAGVDISIIAPLITLSGTQVLVGAGTRNLVTADAIPSLIAHTHVVSPSPTGLTAAPSPELTALLTSQTVVLRSD